ncbi:hypothetical protein [Rufibacter tibetensis]|uniref:HMA domain-containing protein n=1 Tax=Rufibacter tibetensis TaxID=512763 RepID=A0A0P0CZI6_9BACT|nr:hypothetical protein [Rufibacter tibetensis]ALJ00910.1 hypothetical protein DC20_20355 [Rufibacter tibetensis]
MEVLKFKTNISDDRRMAKAAPFLDKLDEVVHWEIDTSTEENILSVAGKGLDPQRVENALREAGFTSEILRIQGIGGESL